MNGCAREGVEVRRERGEQHLVLVGGLEARQAGEADARLPEHVELHLALVRERARRQRRRLRVREEPGAHPLELLDHLIVDLLVDHARLLRRADHRGVERLRDQDVDDRHPDVGAAVHVDRGVAGADAETWLAGGVRRRHRLRPAGRPDEVDPGVVEQVLRDVERRVGDHLQRVRRQPRRLAGLLQELAGAGGAPCGGGRRAHDQGVPCLRADDRLEQRGRRGVGDRQERQDDPDRLSDVFEGMLRVLVDHADRLLVLQVVVEELGGDVVLDHLVLEHTEVRSPPSPAPPARRRARAPRPSSPRRSGRPPPDRAHAAPARPSARARRSRPTVRPTRRPARRQDHSRWQDH